MKNYKEIIYFLISILVFIPTVIFMKKVRFWLTYKAGLLPLFIILLILLIILTPIILKYLQKRSHQRRGKKENINQTKAEKIKTRKLDSCKKNLILVLGYTLVASLLFVPFIKHYAVERKTNHISWEKKEGYIFSPILIYKMIKAEKGINVVWIMHERDKAILVHELDSRFLDEFLKSKGYLLDDNKESSRNLPDNVLLRMIEEFLHSKGYTITNLPNYEKELWINNRYMLNVELLISELAIICLAGGFLFIVVCILLRRNYQKDS